MIPDVPCNLVRRAPARPVLLLLLVFTFGCGESHGTISGRVLYNDKPVPGGWISFCPADARKNSVTAPLDRQGAYEAKLPTGEVRIAIDNRELAPSDRENVPLTLPPGLKLPDGKKLSAEAPRQSASGKAPAASSAYLAIPEKYYDVDTSGLKFTIQSGTQTHDILLK